ncbi:hypothetical protein EVAR_101777_1 [Eumeta japonica]|uniref:Uncharacterized protein n=1 Tax=Eumeta variegata TaxID=151549 RepID=A0A4C1SQ92_EUMVA|nr:hypothetical protein EVAR_101777_1 [Eumeta japonica]
MSFEIFADIFSQDIKFLSLIANSSVAVPPTTPTSRRRVLSHTVISYRVSGAGAAWSPRPRRESDVCMECLMLSRNNKHNYIFISSLRYYGNNLASDLYDGSPSTDDQHAGRASPRAAGLMRHRVSGHRTPRDSD